MDSLFDDQVYELDCPECGHEFKKSVSEIESQPSFPCPGCETEIRASNLIAGHSIGPDITI